MNKSKKQKLNEMKTKCYLIRKKVDRLLDIPAGEQWIGHLQVALQSILYDILTLLDKEL